MTSDKRKVFIKMSHYSKNTKASFLAFTLLILFVTGVQAGRVPGKPEEVMERQGKSLLKKTLSDDSNEASGYVGINFKDVDITLFIKFISELTGKNFVVDKRVKGKVTIISANRISKEEAYKVFESVLEVHGFTTVPAGSIIKIVPAEEARVKNIETRLHEEVATPEDKVVTQLIRLRYANPDELRKLFKPLISKNSVIVSYPSTKMLIITDVFSNIQRLLRIINTIDVEGLEEEVSVIPLRYATASNMVKLLRSIFQLPEARRTGGGRDRTVLRIMGDDRTNNIIILASEKNTTKIKRLVKILDSETPRWQENIHVCYLQHARAEDLATILQSLSKAGPKTKTGKTPTLAPGIKIVADKATNALIIAADKDDYRVLEGVIKKLDITRPMVYIEALIMEVKMSKEFRLGVEWMGMEDFAYEDRKGGFFAGSGGVGDYTSIKGLAGTISPPSTGTLPPGFSLGVIGEAIVIKSGTAQLVFPNLGALFQAYQTDSDVRILSAPQILTTDNEEAEIKVGKNVPYVTRKETTDARLDYSTYEYKDVGIVLRITPQINQERFVRLNIFQEVTKLIQDEGLKEGHPTTLKRSARTTVIVKDNNTVVIGGLIGDDISNVNYKVPCLGDIPLFGWFFKSVSGSREKTNLFVFLTPHIIRTPEEAELIYKKKRKHIDQIDESFMKGK